MGDIVDRETRSRMMSRIRDRDTKPELIIRRYLHRHGLRYRLHVRDLPGAPDIVLPRHGAVVFAHGCFWHQHPGCRFAYQPKSNVEFWRKKLSGNVERDARTEAALRGMGWRVFTAWECRLGNVELDELRQAVVGLSAPEDRIPDARSLRRQNRAHALSRKRAPDRASGRVTV